MDIFTGGEHSTIEFYQAALLAACTVLTIAIMMTRPRDGRYLLAAFFVGLLLLMLGRELSYGKYHGVPHPIRTVTRTASIIAVLMFWAAILWKMRPHLRSVFDQTRIVISKNRWLLSTILLTLVVSQMIDKDWLYVIRPPELAQALEEGLEFVAYIFLGYFLWRQFREPGASAEN